MLRFDSARARSLFRTRPWNFGVLALVLFALLALTVCFWGLPYFGWDLAVSHFVQELPGSGTPQAMHFLSFAGDDPLESGLLVALAAMVLLVLKARRAAIALLGAVLISQALKIGIKLLIGRPRPSPDLVSVRFSAHEIYSFPSGHTVHYTVFFGFLCFLCATLVKPVTLRWPLCFLFGGLVLVIGLARILLGAHWVSDVVGGYLLGAVCLTAGIGFLQADPARNCPVAKKDELNVEAGPPS